jgi:hypothetical protein
MFRLPVLILFPVLYIFLYLGELKPEQHGIGSLGYFNWLRTTHYRINGDFANLIFGPLNRIDRKLRPGYWNSVQTVDCSELAIPHTNTCLVDRTHPHSD